MNFITQLEHLGLNGRQSKVYLALLQSGGAGAIELAKATGFKHPTVYDVLDVLKQQGLVSETVSGKHKRFLAESPSRLAAIEARRQQALDEILPDLEELYKGAGKRPRIRFYQGSEVTIANDDLLSTREGEYFYFGSVQEMFKTSGEAYLKEFYRNRIAKGIWSNAIRNPAKETTMDFMQPGDHNLRRVRYLPMPISDDIAGLYLYDGKVAIHSALGENYAAIIESRELYTLLKTIWKCLWAVSTPSRPPSGPQSSPQP